ARATSAPAPRVAPRVAPAGGGERPPLVRGAVAVGGVDAVEAEVSHVATDLARDELVDGGPGAGRDPARVGGVGVAVRVQRRLEAQDAERLAAAVEGVARQ